MIEEERFGASGSSADSIGSSDFSRMLETFAIVSSSTMPGSNLAVSRVGREVEEEVEVEEEDRDLDLRWRIGRKSRCLRFMFGVGKSAFGEAANS